MEAQLYASGFSRKLQMLKRLRPAITALLVFASCAALAQPAFKVEVRGAGEPIILIPGSGMSGDSWNETAARLCGPRQCHILTLAGFAGTPPLAAGRLLEETDRQLADYVDRQQLKRPVLIGHSLGGFIALKFAADHPDKVGRLVIVDTMPALGARNPATTPEQMREMAEKMRTRMEQSDHATFKASLRKGLGDMVSKNADLERVVAWAEQSDRNTIVQANYDMLSNDLRPALARVQAPTLVLGTWIAYQNHVPKAASEAIFRQQYAKLNGVVLEMADRARHFIMLDDLEWLVDRIDAFLNKYS